MMDEQEFRRIAEDALDSLKQHLFEQEDRGAEFEVEEQGGVMNVLFEEPAGKFVLTQNAPVRQIWISALDWDAAAKAFVLPRTGETLIPLADRLIAEQLAS
jgi:CyaY protein